MQPDIRYYFQLVKATDLGTETIYVNTERLVEKTRRKYPATILHVDNVPLPENYGVYPLRIRESSFSGVLGRSA